MPHGKPAGVRCIHLSEDYRCLLYEDGRRPDVCAQLQPSADTCGASREEALRLLSELESATAPESSAARS